MKAWSSNTSLAIRSLEWQAGRQTNRQEDTPNRRVKKNVWLSNLLYNNLGRFPCSIEAYEQWAKYRNVYSQNNSSAYVIHTIAHTPSVCSVRCSVAVAAAAASNYFLNRVRLSNAISDLFLSVWVFAAPKKNKLYPKRHTITHIHRSTSSCAIWNMVSTRSIYPIFWADMHVPHGSERVLVCHFVCVWGLSSSLLFASFTISSRLLFGVLCTTVYCIVSFACTTNFQMSMSDLLSLYHFKSNIQVKIRRTNSSIFLCLTKKINPN